MIKTFHLYKKAETDILNFRISAVGNFDRMRDTPDHPIEYCQECQEVRRVRFCRQVAPRRLQKVHSV